MTTEERFNKEFLCQIPEHAYMSDHIFAHDKDGRLPAEFLNFAYQEKALQAQQFLDCLPEEKDTDDHSDFTMNMALNMAFEQGYNFYRQTLLENLKKKGIV